MKNILVINGHITFPSSTGGLNKILTNTAIDFLSQLKYTVNSTIIDDGYEVKNEIEKWLAADLIIFQYPIYWFGMPGKMKFYIEEILTYGENFVSYKVKKYGTGHGAKIANKLYMLSTTWYAPKSAFKNDGFLHKTPDEILLDIHLTMKFCGLKNVKNFHTLEANRENIDDLIIKYKEHLMSIL